MTDALFVLLPSPLLGAASWEPTAEALRRLGHDVVVPGVPGAPDGPPIVLAAYLQILPMDRPIVLVPHSNAGLYVPVMAIKRRVVATVFADAALPGDADKTAMAPVGMRDAIAALVRPDGLLPPWTRWWDDAEVAVLFPSTDVRDRVESGQPRLPLAYFDAALPVPPGWDEIPSAYLAFGDTYAAERVAAEERGWPVSTLHGAHLHMLVAPGEVAAEIDRLVRLLLDQGSR